MEPVVLSASAPLSPPFVLYDGECPFCRAQVARLRRWVPDERIGWHSFRVPGTVEAVPGLTWEEADRALQFVGVDGRRSQGVDAIVRVLRHRWWWWPAALYYLPGIRFVADAVYAAIARRRLRLAGGRCTDDVCTVP